MAHLIDKDALVTEIYKLKKSHDNWSCMGKRFHQDYETLLSFIKTLEEKEENSIKKACYAYCKVCGHYAHTTPIHICRQACDYYKDFKEYIERENE